MFKWLFGRKKEEPRAETTVEPAQTAAPAPVTEAPTASAVAPEPTPVAAPSVATPAAVNEIAPIPVVETAPAAAETSTQTPKTALLKQSLSLLADGSDMEPKVGLDAVAVAPPLIEPAKVVKVQAGGRRVVASFGNSAKVRVYSKRADGTYRLEGAPTQTSSRLIVGATA